MIPCRAVDRLEITLRDRTLLHAEILEGNLGHLCNRWHCCTCRSCLRERALRRCAERLRLRTRARCVALRRCADRPRLALRRPLRPPLPPRATARRNRSAPRRPPRRPEGAPLQVPPSKPKPSNAIHIITEANLAHPAGVSLEAPSPSSRPACLARAEAAPRSPPSPRP